MTRRDAGWLIAKAAAAAGAAGFFEAHSHTAPADPHNWTTYQPKFFSPDEFQMLEAFTAIIIPTDDTPGAKEGRVTEFIDFVVNASAEYAPKEQDRWRHAVAWLRKANFADKRAELVEQMSIPESEGFATYRLIKEMTVHAFYTSRVGLVDVLEYQGIGYLTEFPGCTHPAHRHV
jgi:hypothetical protein